MLTMISTGMNTINQLQVIYPNALRTARTIVMTNASSQIKSSRSIIFLEIVSVSVLFGSFCCTGKDLAVLSCCSRSRISMPHVHLEHLHIEEIGAFGLFNSNGFHSFSNLFKLNIRNLIRFLNMKDH